MKKWGKLGHITCPSGHFRCSGALPLQLYKIRFLAHLSKSNSRTFQGLSRTIRRIYKN